jgi:DNA-directed RNA polymerase subunit K/omega
MAYQPLEKLLPRANYSIYKLVRMASLRAMELADGRPKLIEIPSSEKTATIALEEVMSGKVRLKGIPAESLEPAVESKQVHAEIQL